jgi:glucan phosphoethanolaminetransferase (alkaline phosphatase superfamily)
LNSGLPETGPSAGGSPLREQAGSDMNILERLDKQPKKYQITISILLILLAVLLEYWTGSGYRMKIFYLVPISYAAWYAGKIYGIAFSIVAVMTMLYPDMASGTIHGDVPLIWNMAMYFAFFVIVILLLSKLRSTMQQLAGLITKMQNALNAVQELSGILPICANCKKIRDDEGYWHDVDVYISRHTKAEFTHGICAECANKLYPSLFDKIGK